jgi:hypothetical protein
MMTMMNRIVIMSEVRQLKRFYWYLTHTSSIRILWGKLNLIDREQWCQYKEIDIQNSKLRKKE